MMKCPSEGDLRLSLMGGDGDEAVCAHVDRCDRCTDRVRHMERTAGLVDAQLSLLGGGPTGAGEALGRFSVLHERKTGVSEFGRRRFRLAYAVGIVAMVIVASMFVTPVRLAAVGLLNVFRVEKFAAITVDVSQPPMNVNVETMARHEHGRYGSGQPDPNVFGTYSGPLKPEKPERVGSPQEASEKVGRDLADAGSSIGGLTVSEALVSKAQRASYTFDTAKIRKALDEKGLTSVPVPQQIDGKTFTINIPQGVFVHYGSEQSSVVFAQGDSPTLEVPDGVNMDYLRQDFLMIPGLPADLTAQVQEIKDWQHTLIVPLPPGGKSSEVKIDGAEGLLITDRTGDYHAVLWQRDGRLYALGGKLSSSEALAAARAVRYP